METKKVIIRSDRAGVFYGELTKQEVAGDKLMVELKNARRVFYWSGASSLSQLAVDGTKRPDDCKITLAVDTITVVGVIEVIPMTERAIKNLDSVRVWKL